MGYLIPTEVDNSGHIFTFEYPVSGSSIRCSMLCSCGWTTNIKSYEHSWSVVETKVSANEHLIAFGISPQHPIALFTFEDYPSKSV
jgi:hypothetical protein